MPLNRMVPKLLTGDPSQVPGLGGKQTPAYPVSPAVNPNNGVNVQKLLEQTGPSNPSLRQIASGILRANVDRTSVGRQVDAIQAQEQQAEQQQFQNQFALMQFQWNQSVEAARQGNADAKAVIDTFATLMKDYGPDERASVWAQLDALPYGVNAQNVQTEIMNAIEATGVRPVSTAPDTLTVREGNDEVTYAWNSAEARYVEVARGSAFKPTETKAPSGYRFKPDGTLEPIPGGPADMPGGSTKPPSGYRWDDDGNLEPIPGGPADNDSVNITPAQEANNAEIDKARELLFDLPPEEIRLRAQKTILNRYDQQVPNPDYDPVIMTGS